MTETRRRRPLIVSAIILVSLVAVGLAVKGLVVARIRSAIEATFHFDAIKVIAFPPALVIDGVRSVSTSPSFIARRVEIQIPFSALFRREKAFRVFIDGPVVRFRDAAPGSAPVNAAATASEPRSCMRDGRGRCRPARSRPRSARTRIPSACGSRRPRAPSYPPRSKSRWWAGSACSSKGGGSGSTSARSTSKARGSSSGPMARSPTPRILKSRSRAGSAPRRRPWPPFSTYRSSGAGRR